MRVIVGAEGAGLVGGGIDSTGVAAVVIVVVPAVIVAGSGEVFGVKRDTGTRRRRLPWPL